MWEDEEMLFVCTSKYCSLVTDSNPAVVSWVLFDPTGHWPAFGCQVWFQCRGVSLAVPVQCGYMLVWLSWIVSLCLQVTVAVGCICAQMVFWGFVLWIPYLLLGLKGLTDWGLKIPQHFLCGHPKRVGNLVFSNVYLIGEEYMELLLVPGCILFF